MYLVLLKFKTWANRLKQQEVEEEAEDQSPETAETLLLLKTEITAVSLRLLLLRNRCLQDKPKEIKKKKMVS